MRALAVCVVIVAALGCASTAHGQMVYDTPSHQAPSGFSYGGGIMYAYANASFTQGRASVAVGYQSCGYDGQASCSWYGWAYVQPASKGDCESRPNPAGAGKNVIWRSPEQTTDGMVESGERRFALDGARGQRVCVALTRGSGATPAYHVIDGLMDPEPEFSPTPGPVSGTPLPTLSLSKGLIAANAALAKKFGRSWRKGKRRKLTCRRTSVRKGRCSASWRYHGRKRRGKVTLTMTGSKVKATAR